MNTRMPQKLLAVFAVHLAAAAVGLWWEARLLQLVLAQAADATVATMLLHAHREQTGWWVGAVGLMHLVGTAWAWPRVPREFSAMQVWRGMAVVGLLLWGVAGVLLGKAQNDQVFLAAAGLGLLAQGVCVGAAWVGALGARLSLEQALLRTARR